MNRSRLVKMLDVDSARWCSRQFPNSCWQLWTLECPATNHTPT